MTERNLPNYLEEALREARERTKGASQRIQSREEHKAARNSLANKNEWPDYLQKMDSRLRRSKPNPYMDRFRYR